MNNGSSSRPGPRPKRLEPLWHMNLAARPCEKAPASVAQWLLLAIIGVSLFFLDLSLVGHQSFAIFKVFREQGVQEKEAGGLLEQIRTMQNTLNRLDTKDFRKECQFLNQQLDARWFSWSRLLDALESVMPPSVRVTSITPRVVHIPTEHVVISLTVEARSLTDFTNLITSFYESGEFFDIQIQRESPDPAKSIVIYDLNVKYQAQKESLKAVPTVAKETKR